MGFSIAGSGGIVFVALIITFSVLSGAFYSSMEGFESDINESTETRISKQQTDVEIRSIIYNRTNNRTVVEVKNVGSEVLNASKSNAMLDGLVVPEKNVTYEVIGERGYHWPPGEILEIKLHDVDLDFHENLTGRVESKVDKGVTYPGSISSNPSHTYAVEEGDVEGKGDVLVYDKYDNLVNRIDGSIKRANDLSSTSSYLYLIDNRTEVMRFDTEGNSGQTLIPETEPELDSPRALSVTDENPVNYIYVLDNNTDIHRFNLDGTYQDTPVENLQGAIDLYVTDHIYVVNSTANSIDRYALDGTGVQEPFIDALQNPTNVTVSDQHFQKSYIYVVDENSYIRVFDTTGSFVTKIEDQLGINLWGIDVDGSIYISNGYNGFFRLYLGPNFKFILQNGIADHENI